MALATGWARPKILCSHHLHSMPFRAKLNMTVYLAPSIKARIIDVRSSRIERSLADQAVQMMRGGGEASA
jgi:hypothetical protein